MITTTFDTAAIKAETAHYELNDKQMLKVQFMNRGVDAYLNAEVFTWLGVGESKSYFDGREFLAYISMPCRPADDGEEGKWHTVTDAEIATMLHRFQLLVKQRLLTAHSYEDAMEIHRAVKAQREKVSK